MYFQGEDVAGLDVTALEQLQNLHVEAITKICHAKVILLSTFVDNYCSTMIYMLEGKKGRFFVFIYT